MKNNVNTENAFQEDYNTPYEVKAFEVNIDREKCLSSISENTIQFVEKKIKVYKDKIDSENILRAYARNEHKNNLYKAKGYAISAVIIVVLANIIFWGGSLCDYLTLSSVNAMNLGSVAALLIYPMFIALLIGVVICVYRAIRLNKNSNIILDSYSMKYKRWDLVIAESKVREEIYLEEIERLELLDKEMKEERERIKENLRRIEEERSRNIQK